MVMECLYSSWPECRNPDYIRDFFALLPLTAVRMQLELAEFFLTKESMESISEIFPHLKIHTNLFNSKQ